MTKIKNIYEYGHGKQLRQVLAAMVTNTEVLARIAPIWTKYGNMFSQKEIDLAGGWCVEHYQKYGEAPGKKIRDYADDYAESVEFDEATLKLLNRILCASSDEYARCDDDDEQLSTDYLIDLCQRELTRSRQQRVVDEIRMGRRDPAKVDEMLSEYQPIDFSGKGRLTIASNIEPKEAEWLWEDWIPRNELTIIDGDPGSGKSQMTIDIIARLTRGWAMPPFPRKGSQPPANAIVLSTEDDAPTVIRPRLDAVGADTDRVLLLGHSDRLPTFPKDLRWLENEVMEHQAGLVVIDPFYGFLGGKVDSNNDPKIRQTLGPMASIAHKTGAAIVLIRHLNKKSDEPVMYRGGGSIAVLAQARSAIIIGRNPEEPETRVMAINKASLCRPPKSIAFGIESVRNELDGTSRIEWIGEVELEAADIVKRPKGKQGRPTKVDVAVERIQELLADGQTMPAKELQRVIMQECEIGERTFRTARKKIGVKSRPEGFRGERIAWIPQKTA